MKAVRLLVKVFLVLMPVFCALEWWVIMGQAGAVIGFVIGLSGWVVLRVMKSPEPWSDVQKRYGKQ